MAAGLMAGLMLPVQLSALEFTGLDRGRGLQLFNNYCVACHGEDGAGSSIAREDLNPNLPILLAAADATPKRYFEKIYHGGGGMPQMHDELSEVDIWNIVYAIPLIRQRQHSEWHPDKFNNWQNGLRKESNGSD
ncbi:MAG: c-type cytochrome [Mariprofundaceae bacterium]|nr:c-type cytochrome [Mariprofundaceae bacterium]